MQLFLERISWPGTLRWNGFNIIVPPITDRSLPTLDVSRRFCANYPLRSLGLWPIFSRCGTTMALALISLSGLRRRRQDLLQSAFSCSLALSWRVSPQLLCSGEARLLIVSGLSIRLRTSSSRPWAVWLGFSSWCSPRPSSRQELGG